MRNVASTAQDRSPGSRVCEGHIFKRTKAPFLALFRQHCEYQRVHYVWSGRVAGAGRETTPEMYDSRAVSNVSDIDQLVLKRSVAIDRFVNGTWGATISSMP